MLKDYDWINTEKHLFGQPNSAYDFKTNNPKEAGQRLQKLQEMKEKLGRNVNMRAMNVLTEAEERVSPFPLTGHLSSFDVSLSPAVVTGGNLFLDALHSKLVSIFPFSVLFLFHCFASSIIYIFCCI